MAIVFVNNAYLFWAPKFAAEKFAIGVGEAGKGVMLWHHLFAFAAILAGGIATDHFVKKMPRFRLGFQAAALLCGAPALLWIGRAPSLTALLIAASVYGVFRGFFEVNTHASLFDVVAPQHRSTAVGLLTLLCFPKPHRGDAAPVYQPPSDRALRRALLRILIPVAAASLVTNLTTLIDLATGLRLLEHVILAAPASFGMKPELTQADAADCANFQFGAFSGMAVTVFNLLPAVTNMLGKGVFPAFAASFVQHRHDESAAHARHVMQRTAFLAIPAGCGMTALAEPILRFLFPSRMQEIAAAAGPLAYLGIAVIFAALSYPVFSMLQAAGHAGDTVTVMLCGAAVKLTGNLLLIPRLGLSGTALSTGLCYAVILLLGLRQLRLRTGIRLHLLRESAAMLSGGILCALTAAAVYRHLLPLLPQRPALLAAVGGGAAVYLIRMLLAVSGQRKAAKPV